MTVQQRTLLEQHFGATSPASSTLLRMYIRPASDDSFRRVEITTNQPAVQVYTGNYLDTPRKAVHGGPTLLYGPHSAVAIEQEGYIAAINNPEWNIDQICESINVSSWSPDE